MLIAGVSIILFGIGYCGYQVFSLSRRQVSIKKDYMTVNSVSFGLLSVMKCRDNLVAAAKNQIRDFKLTPKQSADLKKEIEVILHSLIEKAVASIRKPQKTVGGKLEKFAFNSLVSVKDLHKDVPGYAQKIIEEINKPSSYNRLKNIAQTEVDSLGSKTYDSSKNAEKSLMDSIFNRYNAVDKPSFEKQTVFDLSQIRKQTYTWAFGMLGGIIIILLLWWLLKNRTELHTPLYIMSIISALILLVVGLNTTMIQIDARIASMDFHLLGQNII